MTDPFTPNPKVFTLACKSLRIMKEDDFPNDQVVAVYCSGPDFPAVLPEFELVQRFWDGSCLFVGELSGWWLSHLPDRVADQVVDLLAAGDMPVVIQCPGSITACGAAEHDIMLAIASGEINSIEQVPEHIVALRGRDSLEAAIDGIASWGE